jgi:hypothetical protein
MDEMVVNNKRRVVEEKQSGVIFLYDYNLVLYSTLTKID